jgi:short-subunit dehydrogenase involved in D-alanine esterification of teichoic acids
MCSYSLNNNKHSLVCNVTTHCTLNTLDRAPLYAATRTYFYCYMLRHVLRMRHFRLRTLSYAIKGILCVNNLNDDECGFRPGLH